MASQASPTPASAVAQSLIRTALLPALTATLLLTGCVGGSLLKVMQPVPDDLSHRLTARNTVYFDIRDPVPDSRVEKKIKKAPKLFAHMRQELHKQLNEHSRRANIQTAESPQRARLQVQLDVVKFNPSRYRFAYPDIDDGKGRSAWDSISPSLDALGPALLVVGVAALFFCCPATAEIEATFLVENQPAGKILIKLDECLIETADNLVNYISQHFVRYQPIYSDGAPAPPEADASNGCKKPQAEDASS